MISSDSSQSRDDLFVDVAVPLPLFRVFTYSVPPPWSELALAGSRALVPFRNKRMVGLIVAVREGEERQGVRPVERILEEAPLLSDRLLELGRWLAAYYLSPPGEVFRTMLPPGMLLKTSPEYQGPKGRIWPVKRKLAVIEISPENAGIELTERQARVLEQLRGLELPALVSSLVRESVCTSQMVRKLDELGVLTVREIDISRDPWQSHSLHRPGGVRRHVLNDEQRQVLERAQEHLERGGFQSMLVHGVTGSGKTEIYLNAIEHALAGGGSALMLVPEIGLTPQVSYYFRSWFGERAAILHSGLSDGERFDQWRRIHKGEARVVIGTRSAVFAPLVNLRLVIVDEEHDASYKQDETPRYNGRDTALKRAQLENALVILGSATPQLETFYSAQNKSRPEYRRLSSRVLERSLPLVHIVDMRVEFQKRGKAAVISDLLQEKIGDRLAAGEQVLILLNRRGYAPLLMCRSCGETETCTNCSISLTFHQEGNRLTCHYCNYSRSVPSRCRKCDKEYIYFVGEGTEKIQELISGLFPRARVGRLDRDTVGRKGRLEEILSDFAAGRTDILIGTQMIAKGHDFPRVTLVGVLAAEKALRLADFRAAERTFQLLTQVAGRAGRGEIPGEVVLQTFYPNHYSLKYACTQDYYSFFQQEIEYRRRFCYPPFTALVSILVTASQRDVALQLTALVVDRLAHHRSLLSSENRMRILGPAPAAIERLKGEYRLQALIKSTSRRELHQVLEKALEDLEERKVDLKKVSIDVDPLSLL
jgi:primosomal protein N' (replication factor Y) (superfamily II helicase)